MCLKFIYFQYEEILKALGTTKLLAIEFKSKEVEDVLDKHTYITCSDDNNSLAMAIVDSCHQIKAEFKFKLEDMVASSKKYLHQLELLQTPKSIEVSTDDIIGIRQEKVGVIENYFINISTNLSTNQVAKL